MKLFATLCVLLFSPLSFAQIPLRSVIGFEPNANGYWTAITTTEVVVSPLDQFRPDIFAGLLNVGPAWFIDPTQQGARDDTQPILEASWDTADGMHIRVVTPCAAFQFLYQCVARHAELVKQMRIAFPVKGQG